MPTPHRLLDPDTLPRPTGFSQVVIPAPGRTIYLAGQIAQRADGTIPQVGIVEQFDLAAANVVRALAAVGARPEHLVQMLIFTSDLDAYRASLAPIGEAYRRHVGRHYPAMSLFEVSRLFDDGALVELVCTAVVPDDPAGRPPGEG